MNTGGWPSTVLGDVVDFFDSKRVPLNSSERQQRQGAFPYYGAQGIIDHIDDYIFDGAYLLVAEDGENLNSRKLPVALIATGKYWVNNHAHIIRGREGLADDQFLLHAINHLDLRPYITGAAQPKLSQGNLRQIALNLPPIQVQRRIASILSAYDDLIENNRKRIAILEDIARRLYREWFVHFRYPGHEAVPLVDSPLGRIPQGWEASCLGRMCDNFDRKRRPLSGIERQSRPGPYRYYGAAKPMDSIDAFIFDGEYLLLAEDGSVITDDRRPMLQLVNEKFWPNNHTHILQGRAPASTHFLYLALNCIDISPYITGAAQPKITQENMNRIPLVCATDAVHSRFDAMVGPMIQLLQNLERQIIILRRTRDLLLPRLMSGTLSVEALATAEAAAL